MRTSFKTRWILLMVCILPSTYGSNPLSQKENSAGKTIIFSEDLRIEGDEYSWVGGDVSFDVDLTGHIFVADHSENQIIQFAPNGKEVKKIGRKGDGPEEFFQLRGFFCFDDGSYFALNRYLSDTSMHFWDSQLTFREKRRFHIEKTDSSSFPLFSRDGKYFFASVTNKGELWKRRDIIFNAENKLQLTLCESEFQRIWVDPKKYFGQKPWYPLQIRNKFYREYAKRVSVSFDKDRIYTASNQGYEIVIYDQGLQLLHTVTRRYKPHMIRNAHFIAIRESILASYQGDYRKDISLEDVISGWKLAGEKVDLPPVLGVVPLDGKGFLAIRHVDPETFIGEADFFNENGQFQDNVDLPKMYVPLMESHFVNPLGILIRGKYVYVLEPNDDFEFTLVRYRWEVRDL